MDYSRSEEIEITDLSRAGTGVGRLSSGIAIFVPYAAPGDRILVEILKVHKNYALGSLKKLVHPSQLRVQPRCAYFGECGGCDWQHLPYELQWSTKRKGVLEALQRSGVKLETSLLIDEFSAKNQEFSYRNRIQLKRRGQKTGFFAKDSHSLVDISRCEIAQEGLNQALALLRKEKSSSDFTEIELTLTDENVSKTESMRRGAMSFRQINDVKNKELQNYLREHLKPATLLFDLYGGSGNLSRLLVSKMDRIVCVDRVQPKTAAVEGSTIEFVCQDVNDFLQEWREVVSCATAILDPPREGLGQGVHALIKHFQRLHVQSLALVGCDPDAFSKDTRQILLGGWSLSRLAILDFFPQTRHVEACAIFTRTIS